MTHAALWNLITAPELAILLSQGGTLPPRSWNREARIHEARLLNRNDDRREPDRPAMRTREAIEDIRRFEDATAERVKKAEPVPVPVVVIPMVRVKRRKAA